MESLVAWWRARTPRERKLIQRAMLFLVTILLPASMFMSAARFREDASASLEAARRVQVDVARLREAGATGTSAGDATVRERVLSLAQANGLTPQTIEAADAARVRVTFSSADSMLIYRWMEALGRTGAMVSRSGIVRVEDSDLVIAEFEVMASP